MKEPKTFTNRVCGGCLYKKSKGHIGNIISLSRKNGYSISKVCRIFVRPFEIDYKTMSRVVGFRGKKASTIAAMGTYILERLNYSFLLRFHFHTDS
jgi:hypothetical protein